MANEIVTKFTAEFAQFNKSLSAMDKKLDGLDKGVGKTDKGFKAFTQTLNKNFGAIAIGVGTIIGAVVAINKFSQAATDAEETSSKFANTFNSNATNAALVAENLADSFGLASSEAKKLLADTGDLVIGFGATDEQALSLSERVNTLAIDLGSYTNIEGGAERASKALTSALLGEREAAKALGIVITETAVKEELRLRGQEKLKGEALLLAKAEATLAIATRQSSNAIGDYARTAESTANVTRRLESSTKELFELLGSGVNTVLTPLKSALDKLITGFNDLQRSQQEYNKFAKGDPTADLLVVRQRLSSEIRKTNADIEKSIKLKKFEGSIKSSLQRDQQSLNRQIRKVDLLIKEQEEIENKIALEEENARSEKIREDALLKEKEDRLRKEAELENSIFKDKLTAFNEERARQDEITADLMSESLKKAETEEQDSLDRRASAWGAFFESTTSGITSLFGVIGENLILGGDAWKQFGGIAINAVAGVVSALGKEMLVNAAKDFAAFVSSGFTAGHKLASAGKYTAGAAFAEGTAGVIRGAAKKNFQTGTPDGGFTVPDGFANDSFNIGVSSGERVFVDTLSQQASSSGGDITVEVIQDSSVVARTTQKLIDSNKIRMKVV